MGNRYTIKKPTPIYVWVSIAALFVGLGCFVLYGFLEGWDAREIFTHRVAYIIYALIAVWGAVFGSIKLRNWAKK